MQIMNMMPLCMLAERMNMPCVADMHGCTQP